MKVHGAVLLRGILYYLCRTKQAVGYVSVPVWVAVASEAKVETETKAKRWVLERCSISMSRWYDVHKWVHQR